MNKRLFLALIIMTTWLTSCGGEPISNGVVPDPLQTIEAAAEELLILYPVASGTESTLTQQL
jgi:hypothetical protein